MIEINRKKSKRGFTLAEAMITMLVIAIVSVFSVPVIKKSRIMLSQREDQHSWAAYYNAAGRLVVCNNGSCSEQAAGVTDTTFTPPQGVSKFNITVVGGGGGGAAGRGNPSFMKVFTPNDMYSNNTFVVPRTGTYSIILIGGGGGSGGGTTKCAGGPGMPGSALYFKANLNKDDQYYAIAGRGGFRGIYQSEHGSETNANAAWDSRLVNKLPSSVLNALTCNSGYSYSNIVVPKNDYKKAGGHGLCTVFMGGPKNSNGNVTFTNTFYASGGQGGIGISLGSFGTHCDPNKRDAYNKAPEHHSVWSNSTVPNPIASLASLVNQNGTNQNTIQEKISKDSGSSNICYYPDATLGASRVNTCKTISRAMGLNENYLLTQGIGFGGERHPRGKSGGTAGHGGYIQITDISTFGGGGGQAGTVVSYTLDHAFTETSIPVRIGKGGAGGQVSTVNTPSTAAQQRGKDGGMSLFGTKVIAAGGQGGLIEQVPATEVNNVLTANGQNGLKSPITTSAARTARLSGAFTKALYNGGQNGADGEGSQRTDIGTPYPGLGGAGGGSVVNTSTGAITVGKGGDGASGIVMVTW